ncbi:MAG: hypothetical protein WC696_01130 [Candidatus Methylopumilus sp.]|jgi:hypothetical protein
MNTEASTAGTLNVIRIVCIAAFVLAAIVTIVFFGWWAMKDRIVFGNEKFDQAGWITATASADKTCHRGDMAYDLQQNVLKPGMSRENVTVMLGRPAWEDPQQIEYDLGNCMHVEHGLRLFFNDSNQLTHTRISQH